MLRVVRATGSIITGRIERIAAAIHGVSTSRGLRRGSAIGVVLGNVVSSGTGFLVRRETGIASVSGSRAG